VTLTLGKNVFNRTLKALDLKEKIDKLDLIKIKHSINQKRPLGNGKTRYKLGENISNVHI
jgi:hypothetical protein